MTRPRRTPMVCSGFDADEDVYAETFRQHTTAEAALQVAVACIDDALETHAKGCDCWTCFQLSAAKGAMELACAGLSSEFNHSLGQKDASANLRDIHRHLDRVMPGLVDGPTVRVKRKAAVAV